MIKYFISTGNKLLEIDKPQKNCWIHLEAPSEEEIARVSSLTAIDESVYKSALDEDEIAHIAEEENFKMISIDIPKTLGAEFVNTRPLTLINTNDYLITICTVPTAVLSDFFDGKIKNANTEARTKLIYKIMLNNARRFLYYLKQIDKKSDALKKDLEKSLRNKELLELLELQKSLVYFSASLSADYAVIQKLHNHSSKATEEERDLLEDIMLETKQAIEMCSVYREIIKNTMDAFASVVNNNQNTIMKFLAAITIVLSIPMVIAGWWGMNTAVPWEATLSGFWLAVGISILLTGIVSIFMMKKKMF